MDIKSVVSNPAGVSVTLAAKPSTTQIEEPTIQNYLDEKKNTVKSNDSDRLNKNDIENITEGLNDFMQSINTDIKFVLHQRTGTLMVQVVDMEKNKVLREAPPKELLDVLARIRDFVGALLDKKA